MTNYRRYNDHEIITLIKENDEDAFTCMADKYSRFISKKIHKFNLLYAYDDLHQEGLMLLYKSCLKYDPSYNKTFTRFYETNLERYFMSYIKQKKTRKHKEIVHYTEIKENNHQIRENSMYYQSQIKEVQKCLTKLEFKVYILRETKNYSVELISNTLNIGSKSVYNSLHRAKAKIKQYLKESKP